MASYSDFLRRPHGLGQGDRRCPGPGPPDVSRGNGIPVRRRHRTPGETTGQAAGHSDDRGHKARDPTARLRSLAAVPRYAALWSSRSAGKPWGARPGPALLSDSAAPPASPPGREENWRSAAHPARHHGPVTTGMHCYGDEGDVRILVRRRRRGPGDPQVELHGAGSPRSPLPPPPHGSRPMAAWRLDAYESSFGNTAPHCSSRQGKDTASPATDLRRIRERLGHRLVGRVQQPESVDLAPRRPVGRPHDQE